MTPLPRLLPAITAMVLTGPASAAPDPTDWEAVLEEAQGQTVYWYAWGGSTATNDFISWAADRLEEEYGVTMEHVKVADTADAVTRVLSERQAERDDNGAVDLVWINGPNFAEMKEAGLLFGPFAEQLPNWQYVDVANKTVQTDFTVPTEGFEAPWAMAQMVFMYDNADMEPLGSIEAIGDWAAENPGRFTYPKPADFLGTTFLKQALIGLTEDPEALSQPVSEADYEAITAPLWDYLDRLTPNLWRSGQTYPDSGPAQLQLLADDEIDLAISFSPGEASTAIADNRLPDSIRTFVLEDGTLGNASFNAIPYNSGVKAGAMVLANFLMSPEAQIHAQDPDVLGYGTVLDLDALPEADRSAFEALELGVATLPPEELGTVLDEPHPSWSTRLAEDWTERYGAGR